MQKKSILNGLEPVTIVDGNRNLKMVLIYTLNEAKGVAQPHKAGQNMKILLKFPETS